MEKPKKKKDAPKYKRCPECFTRLPLDATECYSCDQKVIEGSDKYGLAKRPFDWTGYIRAIGLWILLGVYLWWAFFHQEG